MPLSSHQALNIYFIGKVCKKPDTDTLSPNLSHSPGQIFVQPGNYWESLEENTARKTTAEEEETVDRQVSVVYTILHVNSVYMISNFNFQA